MTEQPARLVARASAFVEVGRSPVHERLAGSPSYSWSESLKREFEVSTMVRIP